MYRPVPARIDLPAMEQEVLGFWDANDVFHRSLAATRDGEPWVFYEGPPTANGMPGTHHDNLKLKTLLRSHQRATFVDRPCDSIGPGSTQRSS